MYLALWLLCTHLPMPKSNIQKALDCNATVISYELDTRIAWPYGLHSSIRTDYKECFEPCYPTIRMDRKTYHLPFDSLAKEELHVVRPYKQEWAWLQLWTSHHQCQVKAKDRIKSRDWMHQERRALISHSMHNLDKGIMLSVSLIANTSEKGTTEQLLLSTTKMAWERSRWRLTNAETLPSWDGPLSSTWLTRPPQGHINHCFHVSRPNTASRSDPGRT